MKLIKSLVAVALLLIASGVQAQTVDEIVGKYIDAIGGKDALSKVKSLYIENSLEVMGNQTTNVEYKLDGKGYKSETEFNGVKIINCVNDKNGWTINPMMGGSDAQAMPDELYSSSKDQIYIAGALADYAAKGYTATLDGKDGNNFKLKLVNGKSTTFYHIDGTSGFLVKSVTSGEMMGQQVEVTITYSDYKKTDVGLQIPYTRNVDMGMFQLAYTVSKVEVNKEIDPKIFEMPK